MSRLPRVVRERQAVTLDVAGSERLAARIEEIAPDGLTLALFTVPTRPLTLLGRDGATAEIKTPLGIVRLTGEVEHADSVDLVRFRLAGEADVVQRRAFVRVDAVRPVAVSTAGAEGAIDTWTLNLSAGGLLLAGPHVLEPGEDVWFRLALGPELATVEGAGRVIRRAEDQRRGVVIDAITAREQELIVRFVFAQQRRELRLGTREPA